MEPQHAFSSEPHRGEMHRGKFGYSCYPIKPQYNRSTNCKNIFTDRSWKTMDNRQERAANPR